LEEPVGGMEGVAEPGDQRVAIPVGAYAIELLAQPPAGEVLGIVPALGQEQGRPRLLAARCLLVAGAGPGREARADARLFRGIAQESPQVLAGAPLDGDRLVAPGGAGARVDAADILEDIGLRPRALHLDRFTVSEIGHGLVSRYRQRAGIRDMCT